MGAADICQQSGPVEHEETIDDSILEELIKLPFPPPRSIDPAVVDRVLSLPWKLNKRPLTEVTSRGRKTTVKPETLKLYQDWLVTSDDGCWCKLCKLFLEPSLLPMRYGKFLTKPWRNYGRKQDLAEHILTKYHQGAVSASSDFLAVRVHNIRKPIDEQLNAAKARDTQLKKTRLRAIVRTLVFCSRQNIALRGHGNEQLPLNNATDYQEGIILGDKNRGNFLQLLEFRREAGDSSIDCFINKKAQYTSPAIQNELLKLTSDQVLSKVVKVITKNEYFSVIADETRDVSNCEQLCVAIRYFDGELCVSNEQFLTFLALDSLKGE